MASRLQITLAASLLANVFAFGTIIGGVATLWRQEEAPPTPAAAPRSPIRSAGQALPADERAQFQALMRRVVTDSRDLSRTARQARAQAASLFVQPSFDRAAVAAALDRARTADVTLRTRLETAAVDFAAGLSAPERATLAEALERRGPLRHPPQRRDP